ncbi:MAG: DNA integrity scanning protein DisA nucleotide-binding domain protein [Mycoplasma sp.]|nr:DNA integrity scanning protein DisA nucleotide-binding domain protein [Mycoplasma sp.]
MDITNFILFITIIVATGIIICLILINYLISFFRYLFKHSNYENLGTTSRIRLIHQINDTVKYLTARKIGAIITIQNKVPLEKLRTDGVKIDANISSALLISLFNKDSPLHDGAIIIIKSKVAFAGTFFKITQSSISNKYGARHRAALGIAEQSDSITVVISEETGDVSIAHDSKITSVKLEGFQETLLSFLSAT